MGLPIPGNLTIRSTSQPTKEEDVRINVYCMRHGQKQGGVPNDLAKHTAEGAEQVRQSTRNNLLRVRFDALFRSDLYRTLELVTYVTGELLEQDKGLDVVAVRGFGYLGNPYLDQYNVYAEKLKKQCQKATVADWLREAPEMTRWATGIFRNALFRKAAEAHWEIPNSQNMEENWLIGSHSPHCELLVLDPNNTFALREADIIRYTVMVSSSLVEQHGEKMPTTNMVITESQYIPRGF
jgi:broad specificity phosphatase PhoE